MLDHLQRNNLTNRLPDHLTFVDVEGEREEVEEEEEGEDEKEEEGCFTRYICNSGAYCIPRLVFQLTQPPHNKSYEPYTNFNSNPHFNLSQSRLTSLISNHKYPNPNLYPIIISFKNPFI